MGKPKSKWGRLGRRVAKLKDGESIVVERRGDLVEEARSIRKDLKCACDVLCDVTLPGHSS